MTPSKGNSMKDDYIRRGDAHPRSKLSDSDCRTIKLLYGDGQEITLKQIAIKFECSKSAVHDIVTGRRRITN